MLDLQKRLEKDGASAKLCPSAALRDHGRNAGHGAKCTEKEKAGSAYGRDGPPAQTAICGTGPAAGGCCPQQEENELASISERRQSDDLYESILTLKDLESCKRFFNDLCSPTERRAMEQRFEVARLLQAGTSYMDILEKTGASSATVSRVNRALQYGEGELQAVIRSRTEEGQ